LAFRDPLFLPPVEDSPRLAPANACRLTMS
jgi:hypothetical protein